MSNSCDRGGGEASEGNTNKLQDYNAAIGGDAEKVKKTPMGMRRHVTKINPKDPMVEVL